MGPLFTGNVLQQSKQSRKFLDWVEDNLLRQLVKEPTRGSISSDLLFTKREELVGDVVVRSCLKHSNHKIIELSILVEVRRMVIKTATLEFRDQTLDCLAQWLGGPLCSQSRKAKESKGRLDIPQEENVNGTGTNCPSVR